MRSVNAVFGKQIRILTKNKEMLVQFLLFPAVAIIFNLLIGEQEGMAENMFVKMMAGVFAGMALITTSAGIIAEDKERKSLRLLIMGGVKPQAYLIGVIGAIMLGATFSSLAFGFAASFSGIEFFRFLVIMMLGAIASTLLGATVGILAKNQQAATSLGMPVAMILGFGPMISVFNETVGRVLYPFYTLQINVVIENAAESILRPVLIVLGNIVVLTVLFVIAYRKKGLGNA